VPPVLPAYQLMISGNAYALIWLLLFCWCCYPTLCKVTSFKCFPFKENQGCRQSSLFFLC